MKYLNIFDVAGLVAWPLLGMAVFGMTVFFERTTFFQKVQINASDFLDGIINLLKKNRSLEALTLCEETRGPVAALVRAALLHRNNSKQEMQEAIQSVAMLEIPILAKRQRLLGTVAGLSPMLGLLGSVLSCLDSLQKLGSPVTAVNLNPNFSSALLTTALGLSIAMLAYCGKEFLRSRVDSIIRDMEWSAHGIYRYLTLEIHDDQQVSPSIASEADSS
ncbi:MAG: MotA/TolQ/ExbB proton channel family protein [Verrucomicrobia bacterium]|jgi:biopolymer transport protein ExbB|nr:MotA/TolQ/ExbB proton channel family protein [Verrucomicrobiota bacterium]MDA0723368.1 MotA/TolQ/ExbB proton channel family protein [Verrucomicrobiota bacterium]MDA1045555.1 MotA/TolQ/ExbB proton channel family protein [Verrucomicrobiota bacterium]